MTRQAELLSAIAAALAGVEASLSSQMGDATVCQLQKDGRVTGGIKYDKGRLVALTDLRRSARTGDGVEDAERTALIAGARRTWGQLLEHHKAAAKPAVAWVAYAQGGLDAIDALAAALRAETQPDTPRRTT